MGQAKARGTFEQRLAESLERQRIDDERQAQIDLEYRRRMAEARRLRDAQREAENVEDVVIKESSARPSMRTGGRIGHSGMGLSAATMLSLAAAGMLASATPSRPKPQKDLRKMTLEDFDNL